MMAHCDDLENIEKFLDKKLDRNEASETESHLSLCPDCQAHLGEVERNLEALSAIRLAMGDEKEPEEDCELPDRIGSYRIIGELGRGGMGRVYEAEDAKLKRRIALKLLPERAGEITGSPSRLTRFEREAQLLASINHPNIATIYSLEEEGPHHFLTMELVPGVTLAKRTARGPLALDETLAICRMIAHALTAAHKKGVVHRDLKPENILLTEDGVAKVVDFGLAVALGKESQQDLIEGRPGRHDPLAGTPGFMSPEQIERRAVDHRSDIWAFGCVLYECLTGQRAFGGLTRAERFDAVLHQEPRWDFLPLDAGEPIRDLVKHCLEKDAQNRPRTMGEVRRVIEEEIIRRSRASLLPVRRDLSAIPNNLPPAFSSFIGRRRVMREVRQRLADCRVLTLTGAGGCGKSRLATEVARTQLGNFPDGIWFVELAPLTDPDLLPQMVAKTMKLKEKRTQTHLERLSDVLCQTAPLIILDNCEHLLAACKSFIETILKSGSQLRILATSREPLAVMGEVTYHVTPLDVPGEASSANIEEIGRVEAIELYVERARAVNNSFELTRENVSDVVDICRHLDGIPLALELAAAKVSVMAVKEMRDRLDDRFRLLTGGTMTSLPQHQTLRALIDWSYLHLTQGERTLFRRLSVFASGWSLEAAEAICPHDGIEEWHVLELLFSLVDKSLVEIGVEDASGSEQHRYHMLETVRQYAGERLREAGDEDQERWHHRDYFLALAERAAGELTGRDQRLWINRLTADHDNLRAALKLCLQDDSGAQAALSMSGALGRFWDISGSWSEGRSLLEKALSRTGAGERTKARIRALNWAGNLAGYQRDYQCAEARHQECLALSRELGDRWYEASALNNLGFLASSQSRYEEAQSHHEQSLAIREELGDNWAIALSHYQLGALASRREDFQKARSLLERARTLFSAEGDRLNAGKVLMWMGMASMGEANYGAAQSNLQESLKIHEDANDLWGIAMNHLSLGWVFKAQGELTAARASLQKSLTQLHELEETGEVASALRGLAGLEVVEQEYERAARLMGTAERIRRSTQSPFSPVERAQHDEDLAKLRSSLSQPVLDAEWKAGESMSLEEIVDQIQGSTGAPP